MKSLLEKLERFLEFCGINDTPALKRLMKESPRMARELISQWIQQTLRW